MTFKVLLHKKASKSLEKLGAETRKRMTDSLRELENFPNVKLDIIKIAGEENTFRSIDI
jgi:mRNA-degrading endonuclease RelE of RelBE toxin-antitoxin system